MSGVVGGDGHEYTADAFDTYCKLCGLPPDDHDVSAAVRAARERDARIRTLIAEARAQLEDK